MDETKNINGAGTMTAAQRIYSIRKITTQIARMSVGQLIGRRNATTEAIEIIKADKSKSQLLELAEMDLELTIDEIELKKEISFM